LTGEARKPAKPSAHAPGQPQILKRSPRHIAVPWAAQGQLKKLFAMLGQDNDGEFGNA
jgi:hypothetical protein